jgi:hypothetical protein
MNDLNNNMNGTLSLNDDIEKLESKLPENFSNKNEVS